jgi:hypothetical protein
MLFVKVDAFIGKYVFSDSSIFSVLAVRFPPALSSEQNLVFGTFDGQ